MQDTTVILKFIQYFIACTYSYISAISPSYYQRTGGQKRTFEKFNFYNVKKKKFTKKMNFSVHQKDEREEGVVNL